MTSPPIFSSPTRTRASQDATLLTRKPHKGRKNISSIYRNLNRLTSIADPLSPSHCYTATVASQDTANGAAPKHVAAAVMITAGGQCAASDDTDNNREDNGCDNGKDDDRNNGKDDDNDHEATAANGGDLDRGGSELPFDSCGFTVASQTLRPSFSSERYTPSSSEEATVAELAQPIPPSSHPSIDNQNATAPTPAAPALQSPLTTGERTNADAPQPAPENQNGATDRQLNITDAPSYLDAMKIQSHDRPNVFLDIMNNIQESSVKSM
ncbi:hypothetical protein BJY52DRAFT_1188640 [Lactarius psammicola]|nr:hypothetical protein BJY52DRAFT_1188640 [Lactarius psammicola]